MTRYEQCKCGHIKSHHVESMEAGIRRRGECEQWNCFCIRYELNS